MREGTAEPVAGMQCLLLLQSGQFKVRLQSPRLSNYKIFIKIGKLFAIALTLNRQNGIVDVSKKAVCDIH